MNYDAAVHAGLSPLAAMLESFLHVTEQSARLEQERALDREAYHRMSDEGGQTYADPRVWSVGWPSLHWYLRRLERTGL